MKKRNETRFAKIYLGGSSQPEELSTEALEENPVKTTTSLRRQYKPLGVSTRQRAERGYQNEDFNIGGEHSPFPEPTKDLPFETIAFIARHMYEEKPLKT